MTLAKRKEADDVYVHRSPGFFQGYSEDSFAYERIRGLYRVPFGPILIPVPEDPEYSLNKIYGTPSFPGLWKTRALEPVWNHRAEDRFSYGGASLLEIDDFSPVDFE